MAVKAIYCMIRKLLWLFNERPIMSIVITGRERIDIVGLSLNSHSSFRIIQHPLLWLSQPLPAHKVNIFSVGQGKKGTVYIEMAFKNIFAVSLVTNKVIIRICAVIIFNELYCLFLK